jgi:hypothetical protein
VSDSDSINARLARGEMVAVGSKLYVRCPACRSVIRLNKPLLGSWHFCDSPDEPATPTRREP